MMHNEPMNLQTEGRTNERHRANQPTNTPQNQQTNQSANQPTDIFTDSYLLINLLNDKMIKLLNNPPNF